MKKMISNNKIALSLALYTMPVPRCPGTGVEK